MGSLTDNSFKKFIDQLKKEGKVTTLSTKETNKINKNIKNKIESYQRELSQKNSESIKLSEESTLTF